MPLTIHIPANLQSATDGQSRLSVAPHPATVGELIASLVARYPDLQPWLLTDAGGPASHVHLFVDGQNYREIGGMQTPLGEVREVVLLTALAGG